MENQLKKFLEEQKNNDMGLLFSVIDSNGKPIPVSSGQYMTDMQSAVIDADLKGKIIDAVLDLI